MSNIFRRNSPKIGRNDPCFCGSGRKFKYCHGGPQYELPNLAASARLEREIIAEGKRQFERHKAREMQRQKQQGLGRAIISTEIKGFRFVAVGNRVCWGKWKSFTDFLSEYMKATMGGDWGNAELAKPLEDRHPLMQWYDKICLLQRAHVKQPGETFSTPKTGAVSAYYRLAYNLYLIAHNVKDIQTRLIARLKNNGNFQGAYYETQVAAWLINAGFELEFENEQDTATTHCEFTATYTSTGDKYSVEAKSRETRPGGSARIPVGNQLRKALVKRANHKRLVFIDLNKALHTPEALGRTVERAESILKSSENMEIDGVPAPPAYVCITNMNDQHALDEQSLLTMASFTGFKINDFTRVEFPSLREAARARERHWPMMQLLKSIERHCEIPQTFGGELPSEVFVANPPPRLQVGQLYNVAGPDGAEVAAEFVEGVVVDKKTCAILRCPATGVTWVGMFDMSTEELQDYARHPDTYFGVYRPQGQRVETAMDMFDFLVESHREATREQLIAKLTNYPDEHALHGLNQMELVELVAEQYTYAAMANGFKLKTLAEFHAERRGQPPVRPSDTQPVAETDGAQNL
ncbi:YecA family protein [Trinickia symbiotica]|uniref:YecA family protein n=1 Tax=Trinickia symbiotica TaxID=863227 RepID=UPI0003691361|nr:SEC-C domain-containing protein [Trinickia symbiotica]